MNVNACPGSLGGGLQRQTRDTTAPSTLMLGLRRGVILSTLVWAVIGLGLTLLRLG